MVVACLLAAAPIVQARVGPDSIIDLVYLGGPDCPYCRAWEARELPQLLKMEEYKHIRFTHVSKRISQPVPEPAQLPEHLKPMYDEMVRLTGGRGGSPQFVLLLDGVAVKGGFGTQAYYALLPAMTELVTTKIRKPILLQPYQATGGGSRPVNPFAFSS